MANAGAAPMVLPETLPVFPLTGVVLLPGTLLPLHIFELRYRNMVEDALQVEGVFGMIQPVIPRQDNRPLPGAEKETPELYRVGCAGQIDGWERLPDGCYMILLKGLNRFRIVDELPLVRGYRRVKAQYREFPDSDLNRDSRSGNRTVLRQALERYAKGSGIQLQWDQMDPLPDIELINLMSVSLPFHPAEKQALLEAPSPRDREVVLLNLLRLGSGPGASGSDRATRTLN